MKSVQQMLGHASATLTLDRYGHLFADELDNVAERLDDALRETGVYPMCTRTEAEPAGDDGEDHETAVDLG